MFAPKISEVNNINKIGSSVTDIKKTNFSSRKLNLNLNFDIIKISRPKKGIRIPICLRVNFKG